MSDPIDIDDIMQQISGWDDGKKAEPKREEAAPVVDTPIQEGTEWEEHPEFEGVQWREVDARTVFPLAGIKPSMVTVYRGVE